MYGVGQVTERQDLLAVIAPLAKALRRIEDDAAGRHGLSMWQYAILAVISRRSSPNQAEVADQLGYSRNRIVADVDHLEQHGLVTRERIGDRRANRLRITRRGQTVRVAVQRDIHLAEDELLTSLPPTTRHELERALQRVRTTRPARAHPASHTDGQRPPPAIRPPPPAPPDDQRLDRRPR